MSSAESEQTPLDCVVDVELLQSYIEVLLGVADEAVLHFREGEVYANPVSPDNVSIVNQWLDASAFEAYYASDVRVGIALERLEDYLAKSTDDLVAIRLDAETRKLEIEAGAVDFDMATITADSVREGQDRKEMGAMGEHTVDVTLEAGALAHAVDVTGMVSDHVTIDCDPDRDSPVHVTAAGDTDGVSVEFDNTLKEGSTVDEVCASFYSHEYMTELVSPMPTGAEVRLRTADEWPVALDYEYAGGRVEVAALLAPRIKSR